jgi:hypothetical protein
MNWPLAVLRRFKQLGADGFRGGRVYEAELRAWLVRHPEAIVTAKPTLAEAGEAGPVKLDATERIAHQRLRHALERNGMSVPDWVLTGIDWDQLPPDAGFLMECVAGEVENERAS